MTPAYWFEHREAGGFPVRAARSAPAPLSVLHVGGEWQWLVRRDGRDLAEAAAAHTLGRKERCPD
jgi:hypothetical protein